MLSQGYHNIACNILGFLMFLLIIWNIFSRLKIKKFEIVINVHENMIWGPFQMCSLDLHQSKIAIVNCIFFGYGVHILVY